MKTASTKKRSNVKVSNLTSIDINYILDRCSDQNNLTFLEDFAEDALCVIIRNNRHKSSLFLKRIEYKN